MGGKGGSKSSGGGSSGKVDFPDYMKDWHGDALDGGAADTLSNSITDAINAAYGNSPYLGEAAFDPDSDITDFLSLADNLGTEVSALSPVTDWADYLLAALTAVDANLTGEDALAGEILAHNAIVDDQIISEILPRFQAGMRDINAVNSSQFVIGQAVIEGMAQRDKNKFAADLRIKAWELKMGTVIKGSEDIIQMVTAKLEFNKAVVHYGIEARRIKVVMKNEETQFNIEMDEKDALWDIELFKHGGNLLASISGAATSQGDSGPSKGSSILGGALSGAAFGASVTGGNPIGAAIGGVVGGIGGLLGR